MDHNYKQHANLLVTVAPAFVASLPQARLNNPAWMDLKPPECENSDVLKCENWKINLSFEMRRMLDTFIKEYAQHDLSARKNLQDKAADTLEDFLYCLEDLIDNRILQEAAHRMKSSRLRKLELLSLGQIEQQKWICYYNSELDRPEYIQYRQIARSAQDFNRVMDDIFTPFETSDNSRSTQVYYEDRHQSISDPNTDDQELARYTKAVTATAKIIKKMSLLSSCCQATHEAFICLSGFEELGERITIESIMTVCHPQKWHHVHWYCNSRDHSEQIHGTLPKEMFCQKLRIHHKRKKKLHIQVLHDDTWHVVDPADNNLGSSHASQLHTTLQDVLLADNSMPNMQPRRTLQLRKRERLDLGVRIVRSLLCLTGSPLLESRWRSETMFACEDVDVVSREQARTKAYIYSRQTHHQDEAVQIQQLILDIGLLLWEIFFKQKVVPKDEDNESDDDDTVYNALSRQHDEARDHFLDKDCLEIIEACLDIFVEAEFLPHNKLRVTIHEKIVKPLSSLLQSYEEPKLQDQYTLRSSTQSGKQALPKARHLIAQQVNRGIENGRRSSSILQTLWTARETTSTTALDSTVGNQYVACVAANDPKAMKQTPSVDPDRRRAAEEWFGWHDAAIARINAERRQSPHGIRPVRVAILDSGIELLQDQIDDYDLELAPELVYQSWIDRDNKQWKDKDGHGTHLTILLRKIAPDAAIYVARVYEEDPSTEEGTQIRVAKALRFAVDEWDVDIIIMPFGFGEKETAMESAIRYVASHGRLMFAAASNGGRNRPDGIAWPARDPDVVCIHSGNGDGTRSSFTPSAEDGMRIMVLGECIKSASPPHLNWFQDQMYLDGTSCATPIAAGIAALILDYAQGFLNEEDWHNLRNTAAMKRMFKRMRDENISDYWWIKHWSHFLPTNTRGWIEGEIRLAL